MDAFFGWVTSSTQLPPLTPQKTSINGSVAYDIESDYVQPTIETITTSSDSYATALDNEFHYFNLAVNERAKNLSMIFAVIDTYRSLMGGHPEAMDDFERMVGTTEGVAYLSDSTSITPEFAIQCAEHQAYQAVLLGDRDKAAVYNHIVIKKQAEIERVSTEGSQRTAWKTLICHRIDVLIENVPNDQANTLSVQGLDVFHKQLVHLFDNVLEEDCHLLASILSDKALLLELNGKTKAAFTVYKLLSGMGYERANLGLQYLTMRLAESERLYESQMKFNNYLAGLDANSIIHRYLAAKVAAKSPQNDTKQ